MTEPVPAYVRKATYVTNHDGDSIVLALDHGTYPSSKTITNADLRIRNLYCPELSQPGGAEAAEYTRTLLLNATRIVAQTYKGSFARTIADIWVDGQSLADLVVAAGHGTRTP